MSVEDYLVKQPPNVSLLQFMLPKALYDGLQLKFDTTRFLWTMPKETATCISEKLSCDIVVPTANGRAFGECGETGPAYDFLIEGDAGMQYPGFVPSTGTGKLGISLSQYYPPSWISKPKLFDKKKVETYAREKGFSLPADFDTNITETLKSLREQSEAARRAGHFKHAKTIFAAIESCGHYAKKKRATVESLAVEKGIPPTVLEKMVGIAPKTPAEMKQYLARREVREKVSSERAASAAEKQEAEQSAEAVAAMKGGRKTRRQKKRRATRRR